jgi:squalene-hopene/tetraprenyl-beta-curcumene cyclase
MNSVSPERLEAAYLLARAALLAERTREGYWTGELSTSALATATAVIALALVGKHTSSAVHDRLIAGGLSWLAEHQNADGGWGDTLRSISNISTSMLGRAAFHLTGAAGRYAGCVQRAEVYLQEHGGKTPAEQAEAVRRRYGNDRTFAVPILTTCALAGLVEWREVAPLPFELACLPQSWFRFLRLPVVSYALPALIAIGQAIYHHRPPRNPLMRMLRWCSRSRSLRVLEGIQPSSGGFLEAVPLTSFVTLSLASIGRADHPVARNGVRFLVESVRPDGSWPIDSNLSIWLTTLSLNALAAAGDLECLGSDGRLGTLQWLQAQQTRRIHPYTGAAPGAWGWSHLSGSVPDADDTSGALLAVHHLNGPEERPGKGPMEQGCDKGLRWLLDLQNSDGGWPTFCRGWGHLPFDRSGADLTAHALRALAACGFRGQAIQRGLAYLARTQRADGSWVPLWFGNQFAPDDENPTYGTARVLAAYRDLHRMDTDPARRGVSWLLGVQNPDGGWGGLPGIPSSVEETALAVEVLLAAGSEATQAVNSGLAWLVAQVEAGALSHPTPIGLYFARLWYFEKLYPVIFSLAALGRALRELTPHLLAHSECHTERNPS